MLAIIIILVLIIIARNKYSFTEEIGVFFSPYVAYLYLLVFVKSTSLWYCMDVVGICPGQRIQWDLVFFFRTHCIALTAMKTAWSAVGAFRMMEEGERCRACIHISNCVHMHIMHITSKNLNTAHNSDNNTIHISSCSIQIWIQNSNSNRQKFKQLEIEITNEYFNMNQ